MAKHYKIIQTPDSAQLQLSGDWSISEGVDDFANIMPQLSKSHQSQIEVSGDELKTWDSSLLSFLLQLQAFSEKNKQHLTFKNMPSGVSELIDLAASVPERQGASRVTQQKPLLNYIGDNVLTDWSEFKGFLSFLGESIKSLGRFVAGKAQYRKQDFLEILTDTGPSALPIITLISVLVGIILAFVGAVQLQQFGAEIYTANLVAVAMVREMGCMMVGIIMAGRTGAAFAARIGTMQVNEEIDALKTLGISPMDFLVLPRMLGLVLMMPLLCLYADILGILGGALISVAGLGFSFMEYWNQTLISINMTDINIGLFKSFIFGLVIAITGCMNGIRSGRSASAVGDSTTAAVVAGIVFIVVIDGLFAIVTSVLGI
ncbi:ABC transporter permease [Kangiella sp. TOML190]|uniref:MlaE family ABC transporter permease n=1 Tax=Kangiella sp. TOML190 TaxID=2931351 RepID=UPI00203AEC29|nr:ABC transporter permease [Kangiella sp. TOML190]